MMRSYLKSGWPILCVSLMVVSRLHAQQPQSSPLAPSPPQKIESFDHDSDGKLTITEFLKGAQDPKTRQKFFRMDANGDSVLSKEEWERQGKGVPVRATNLFRGLDGDENGGLSLDEFLQLGDPPARAGLRQKFLVFDLDRDGVLAQAEFLTVPRIFPGDQRGPLRDPLVDIATEMIEGILRQTPASIPSEKFASSLRGLAASGNDPLLETWGGLPAVSDAGLWDANQDGKIAPDELRRGLEIAWGLRRFDGSPARRPTGLVFNINYFNSLDQNRDGIISLKEFLSRHSPDREKSRGTFVGMDANSDGHLNLIEVDQAGFSWLDIPNEFLRWDSDRNGLIDRQEFQQNARDWERNLAAHLLPAFDAEGDGAISLLEYRLTPLASPLYDWNGLKTDVDEDGYLDRSEFYPSDRLPVSLLAMQFFNQFDVDQDGRLSLSEFDFKVDVDRIPGEIAFRALGRDGEGLLTLAEAFEAPPSDRTTAPFLERSREAFLASDQDRDGKLNLGEFLASNALRTAIRAERRLRNTVEPQFARRDANQDRQISLKEYLVDVPADRQAAQRRDWHVLDFDGSGGLSFLEYAALPALSRSAERTFVPDPIAEAFSVAKQAMQARFTVADADKNGRVVKEEWDRGFAGEWYSSSFSEFDLDRNGAVALPELTRGLEVAYGMADPNGVSLRRETAQVFNWRTYVLEIDKDNNRLLTREEILPKFSQSQEENEALFKQIDLDQDGQLAIAEMAAHEKFWIDVLDKFLGWDKDLDGSLSPEEVSSGTASWEKPYLSSIFPGYDADGNGTLSFAEFRATPLANQTLNWSTSRRDLDDDGRLSLAEFHPHPGLAFLGVSKVLFDRLDRNRSGYLEVDEYDFAVNFNRVSPELVFWLLDTNRDGRLSLQEAFPHSSPEKAGPLFPRHQQLFEAMDQDRDGLVSAAEFSRDGNRLAQAITLEKWLRTTAMTAFQARDVNRDGGLTQEEWLAGVAAEKSAPLRGEFLMCDFDGDGKLTFLEFSTLPSVVPPSRRGPVPDPIQEEQERILRSALATRSPRSVPAVAEVLAGENTGLSSADAQSWDRDTDGVLSDEELRTGLEIAYGCKRPGGLPLRRDNGQVFGWRSFQYRDKNKDGSLDLAEYLVDNGAGPEQGAKLFQGIDRDGDGRIALSELADGDDYWEDVLATFRRFDANNNGGVDPSELAAQARSWERGMAGRLFPGFDANQDGVLSLAEFRASLLANPVLDFVGPSTDRDHDGKLSLDEYHPDRTGFGKGLSAIFFHRLDLNQDGTLAPDELEFKIDDARALVELVFHRWDLDGNGSLSPDEALGPLRSDSRLTALLERGRQTFRLLDADGNGAVSPEEFSRSAASRAAVINERRLRGAVAEQFLRQDRTGNGRIEIRELLVEVKPELHPNLQREFRVVDFDGDGRLSLLEFAALSDVSQRWGRVGVPDPVATAAQRDIDAVIRKLAIVDQDRNQALNAAEWSLLMSGSWGEALSKEFDADGDGAVSRSELERGLSVAYGLCDPAGTPLRRESGEVFNWRSYVLETDRNRDKQITREEILPKFTMPPAEHEALFRRFDANQDGSLSVAELAVQEMFWTDILGKFYGLDSNLDGELDPQEIARAPVWERGYLGLLFPAFDQDGNGKLSFVEFRDSPVANQLLVWMGPFRDRDDDGRLGLEEFHPQPGLAFLGLSKLFFGQLDRNQSGFLELDELDFETNFARVPIATVFRALDRDGDGRLTLTEAFGSDGLSGEAHIFYPRHRKLFDQADLNGDGSLSSEELSAGGAALPLAIATEKWLRNSLWPAFQKKDGNGDGPLSQQEWLKEIAPEKQASAAYDFRLADFDGTGSLSFLEFAALSGVTSLERRGPVPDPVLELAGRITSALATSGTEQGVEAVGKAVNEEGVSLPKSDIQAWDRDRDGLLSETEIDLGLTTSLGITYDDGQPMRRENGQMFGLRTFNGFDQDHDGVLVRAEFIPRYWDPSNAEEAFQKADSNADKKLTVGELLSGATLFWSDVTAEFKRFDVNQDRLIGPQELASQARSWETAWGQVALPAFDRDGNGSLSFAEFRLSPLGNPLLDWNSRRSDPNHDGRLSLEEFHNQKAPLGKGLSALYLTRLDRDRDGLLSLRELDFRIDLNKAPTDVLFLALDRDGDRQLTLAEMTSRESPGSDAAAKKRYEEKLMRLEESFRSADRDRSGRLSLTEFSDPGSTVVAALAGKSPRTALSGPPKSAAARYSASATVGGGAGWSWRWIGLIVFNIMLLGGIGWLVLRAS